MIESTLCHLSKLLQVEVMQHELQELAPILERTSREVEDMMVVITNDKKEAGGWVNGTYSGVGRLLDH
jgi:hypothetical protein